MMKTVKITASNAVSFGCDSRESSFWVEATQATSAGGDADHWSVVPHKNRHKYRKIQMQIQTRIHIQEYSNTDTTKGTKAKQR